MGERAVPKFARTGVGNFTNFVSRALRGMQSAAAESSQMFALTKASLAAC